MKQKGKSLNSTWNILHFFAVRNNFMKQFLKRSEQSSSSQHDKEGS